MATASDIKMRIFAEDKTAKAFNSAKSNMNKFAGAAKAAKMGVLAVGAAVAGIGAAAKKFSAMADDIIKFSKRTSIATDALQELSFVASQSGVGAETFNKSMVMMVKNFSDARDGSGMAVDEIRKLGIVLTDNNNKLRPAEALLNDLADKLSGVTNETERLAIATAIFGTRGSVMLQMLDGGAAKMNALRQQARDLGLVMSKDTLENAEKVTDAFDVMSRVVTVQLTTALVELAPVITATAQAIADGAKALKEFFTQLNAPTNADELNAKIKQTEERIQDLKDGIKNATYGQSVVAEKAELKILQEKLKTYLDMQGTFNGLRVDIGKGNQQTAEELGELDKLMKGFNKGMADYKQDFKGVVDETADATKKAFKSMEDALVEFTMTGKMNFKSMAQSIISDLIRIQIRQSITNQIGGSLFGSIGNLFGGGTSATPAPVVDHSVSFAGGGFTGMGARSGGIDGKGGFPAILHPNETVIDHAQGQSSGVVVNQSINVTTGVQQTVRTEIMTLLPQIAEASKAAVLEARLRGGSYASAFGG